MFHNGHQHGVNDSALSLRRFRAERLDYLAGVSFFHSEWDMLWDSVFGIPDFPPPPVPISSQIFNGSYTNTFAQETTAYSVFGQANYSLTEQFRINLGLRFTHEKKKVHFGRANRPPFTLWNAVIQAPFPYQRLDNVTDDLVSGSVSIQYDLQSFRGDEFLTSYRKGTDLKSVP